MVDQRDPQGYQGMSFLTVGQTQWRRRVAKENSAAVKATASAERRARKPPEPQVSDEGYKAAISEMAELRQQLAVMRRRGEVLR